MKLKRRRTKRGKLRWKMKGRSKDKRGKKSDNKIKNN
jgi:hypothetical protein